MLKRSITFLSIATMLTSHAELNVPSQQANDTAHSVDAYIASSTMRNSLLENNHSFVEFLEHGVVTSIPSMFEDKGFGLIQILLTSYDQADSCFARAKQFIHDKNYGAAANGLEVLILSVTEEKLPYIDNKFEDYKQAFLSLATTCGEPFGGVIESDMYFTAGKIIEFISEKQKNPIAAQQYAQCLIEEAGKALNSDFLYSMLHMWCKFHELKGSLSEGLVYVQKIIYQRAINPNMQTVFFAFPAFEADVFFDYINACYGIEKCTAIIDLLCDYTFKALSEYVHEHEEETLERAHAMINYARIFQEYNEQTDDDEELILWENAYAQGIAGIIETSQKRLAQNIVEISKPVAALMQAEQKKVFLNKVQAKLTAQGFSEIAATVFVPLED
jgi:hypothetical protein